MRPNALEQKYTSTPPDASQVHRYLGTGVMTQHQGMHLTAEEEQRAASSGEDERITGLPVTGWKRSDAHRTACCCKTHPQLL